MLMARQSYVGKYRYCVWRTNHFRELSRDSEIAQSAWFELAELRSKCGGYTNTRLMIPRYDIALG